MDAHAYLFIAPSLKDSGVDEKLKTETADTRHLVVDSLGIKDARWLIKESSSKSLSGEKHNFVIFAKSLNLEAQNALLKLFEEPPSDTVFYLIVPNQSLLIPTLRSRLIYKEATESKDSSGRAFLKLSLKDRLDKIAELAKDDPSALGEIVRSLGEDKSLKLSVDAKRALLLTEKYVYNRGASRKMLLEELALSL